MKPRRLTTKQQTYLRQLASGLSTSEIGERSGARQESVCNTIERIRRRLGARHNAHLVALALTGGHISLRSTTRRVPRWLVERQSRG